ncbi:MAG: hypothetical protein KA419_07185 [Acidobacteria bacterium]|nr:hypothetical protein [Acidobacteriota bacterium]
MNKLAGIFLTFLALSWGFSEDKPKPDRWRGMVLDESTKQDVLKAFGEPKKREMNKITRTPIDRILIPEHNKKIFEYWTYEPKGDKQLRNFVFCFFKEKLALISIGFHSKQGLNPNVLPTTYGLEFWPEIPGIAQALMPTKMERDGGRIYPQTYPSIYWLVAKAERSYVMAGVNNFSWVPKSAFNITDSAMSFPGEVWAVVLMSRTLEAASQPGAADVLK